MNYEEMAHSVAETTENTFSDTQMANFFRAVEESLYSTFDFPCARKNATSQVALGNQYISLPGDFISAYSLASKGLENNDYEFLLNKDVNFIREAYPPPLTVGRPKYYAQFDDDTLIVGPTPDAYYAIELHYMAYPETVVTAGTTWLSDNFPIALINGALVEAARFMKEEEALIAFYQRQYDQSLLLLSEYSDGRARRDAYRSGQRRKPLARG